MKSSPNTSTRKVKSPQKKNITDQSGSRLSISSILAKKPSNLQEVQRHAALVARQVQILEEEERAIYLRDRQRIHAEITSWLQLEAHKAEKQHRQMVAHDQRRRRDFVAHCQTIVRDEATARSAMIIAAQRHLGCTRRWMHFEYYLAHNRMQQREGQQFEEKERTYIVRWERESRDNLSTYWLQESYKMHLEEIRRYNQGVRKPATPIRTYQRVCSSASSLCDLFEGVSAIEPNPEEHTYHPNRWMSAVFGQCPFHHTEIHCPLLRIARSAGVLDPAHNRIAPSL